MRQTTLCLPIKGDKILLGMKKRSFGKGKLNGFGGKLNPGETVEEAAIRELFEEVSIKTTLKDMKKVAEIEFTFPAVRDGSWDQNVHIFFINNWEGDPKESEEMGCEWFDTNNLPFDRMWADDKFWLPLALQGKKLKGEVSFAEDNSTIATHNIRVIE